MKKATWLFSSVIAALLTTGAPAVVSAAGAPRGPGIDGNNLTTTSEGFTLEANDNGGTVEADSIAQVNIEGGDLVLKAVPNLSFESKNVKDLITDDVNFQLANGAVDNGPTAWDGNNSKTIEVDDYRGTIAGWTLKADLKGFTGATSINATRLILNGDIKGGDLSGKLSNSNIANAGATVLSAEANKGAGPVTVDITSATLTLPQTLKVKAGNYTATVVWTLSAEPGLSAPENNTDGSGTGN